MVLDRALEYFTTFSEKDSEGLRSMFSDDVILRDWEIIANGIDEVVDANQSIFDSVETIVVNPVQLYHSITSESDVVIAEIEIIINDDETLLVTDILEFDDNNKIKSVRAYKG
jgi:hypothetical protein